MKRYIVVESIVEAHVRNDDSIVYYTKDWKSYRSWTEKLYLTRDAAVKRITKYYRLCRNVQCITNKNDEVVYILVEMNRFYPKTNDYKLNINYSVFEIREISILSENKLFALIDKTRKGFK